MAKIIDKFTKEELEEIVLKSTSLQEVVSYVGYSIRSGGSNNIVRKKLEEYNISMEHFIALTSSKQKDEDIFVESSSTTQSTLRRHYIKGKYSEYKCAICNLEPFWNGKELGLTLDHINGKNNDNRLENLRWVCPNCDRQLDTFGAKNIVNKKINNL